MTHDLVGSLDKAIENIRRYQTEVEKEPRLARRMTRMHAWCATRSDNGAWLFAPSKFVGYPESTARTYLEGEHDRDGHRAEAILAAWFDVVSPGTSLGTELGAALQSFLRRLGYPGPRKNAWIRAPKAILARGADATSTEIQDRVHIDAAICGGRPHIRGTRVRVSDILDLLAHGVSLPDILADYPYLSEADLNAALAYGAAASEHRIIHAA